MKNTAILIALIIFINEAISHTGAGIEAKAAVNDENDNLLQIGVSPFTPVIALKYIHKKI